MIADSHGESQGRSAAPATGREVWQQQQPPPPLLLQQHGIARHAEQGEAQYGSSQQGTGQYVGVQPQQGGGGQRAQYGNSQEGATHQQQVQRGWLPPRSAPPGGTEVDYVCF